MDREQYEHEQNFRMHPAGLEQRGPGNQLEQAKNDRDSGPDIGADKEKAPCCENHALSCRTHLVRYQRHQRGDEQKTSEPGDYTKDVKDKHQA